MTRKTVLIGFLILGLIASALTAVQRVKVESRNKAVELVVDYGEVAQITAATGKPAIEVLRSLGESGITSVAVSEQTVRNVLEEDILDVGSKRPRFPGMIAGIEKRCGCRLPANYALELPVGLPDRVVSRSKRAGLEVIARLVNYPGATPRAIDTTLADVRSKGITKVIFQGDQVLGFKGAVRDTARSLRRHGVVFGRIEFAKQKGEMELAERAQGNVIPVHSITQNEMPALDQATIVERFQKAVRERGVRICYVRMYDTASSDLLRANRDYVRAIAKGITSAGYSLKSAHPMEEVCAPVWARIVAGVGVAAGGALLLLALFNLSALSGIIWSAATIIACAGLAATGDTGRKLVALGSAFVFPTLGALWAVRPANGEVGSRKWELPAMRAIGRLIGAVAITVAGGVLIVGLLSSRAFMLRIDQFMGIKVAHLAPVLILAGAFAGGIAWRADTWTAQKARLCTPPSPPCEGEEGGVRALLERPILMWQAIGLVALTVLIGLMVARSGNDAGLEVSSVELRFRSILDRMLVARPRTKEILGYPVLLLGIALALRGNKRWAAILVTIGSIGLVSALNTFCHIHTPLVVSALRTVNGVVIGAILGTVVFGLARRV